MEPSEPSRAEAFELTTSAPPAPSVSDPRLSLRPPSPHPTPSLPVPPHQFEDEPQTLSAFRANEGTAKRLSRLRGLFDSIPIPSGSTGPSKPSTSALPTLPAQDEDARREELRKQYAQELYGKCSACNVRDQDEVQDVNWNDKAAKAAQTLERWTAFEKYAEEKEKELWRLFVELDVDGDMRLRREEVREACNRAGVEIKEGTLGEFIDAVGGDGAISFEEWRDTFLLLPRPTSMSEIFRFWHTHRANRPSMSQLTQDGDVVVGRGKSGWNKLLGQSAVAAIASKREEKVLKDATNLRLAESKNERNWEEEADYRRSVDAVGARRIVSGKGKEREYFVPHVEPEEDEDERESQIEGMLDGAGKFLLAGGLAGAVSRTATAPFDRLKVYLITSPTIPLKPPSLCPSGSGKSITPRRSKGSLPAAVRAVWKQGGGPKAFWTGNGLNVVKIFPESAIKFLSYESAKRVFAQYVDEVPDQTLISNSSRFVAGGIGGVVSQFVIYPIETLKTRVMSSTGGALAGNALIARTAANMWKTGGIRLYFKGLTAGLIGVFPYSAIDMSTFEGIKLAYTKWAGREPGIPGSLAFGALSGGIGATSVYPLNLIRTRLQAQGTPAHPQRYDGVRDAAARCYHGEGWRGFYKGLTPTLVKVVPAVAISYAVYDLTKKALFAREELESQREHDSQEE